MARVRVRRNIDPYYWSLWAVRRANAMPDVGYPTQVPWYQPARLGNVEVEEGPPRMPAMVDDWRVVDRIDVAVNEHLRRRPSEVRALEIYERAYRNAADTFEKRCEDCGVVVATCRRMAIRAKAAIDQAVGEVS